jgi:hypothetical protein
MIATIQSPRQRLRVLVLLVTHSKMQLLLLILKVTCFKAINQVYIAFPVVYQAWCQTLYSQGI